MYVIVYAHERIVSAYHLYQLWNRNCILVLGNQALNICLQALFKKRLRVFLSTVVVRREECAQVILWNMRIFLVHQLLEWSEKLLDHVRSSFYKVVIVLRVAKQLVKYGYLVVATFRGTSLQF